MTWIGQQRVQDTRGPARQIPGGSVAWVYGSKLTRTRYRFFCLLKRPQLIPGQLHVRLPAAKSC